MKGEAVKTRIACRLATCAVALLMIATPAAAQDSWRVVQAPDGSLYLIAAGLRFAVNPEPVSDDDVNAYPDGGSTSPFQVAAQPAPAAAATPTPQWRTLASWFKVSNCHDVCLARLTESVPIGEG